MTHTNIHQNAHRNGARNRDVETAPPSLADTKEDARRMTDLPNSHIHTYRTLAADHSPAVQNEKAAP